MYCTLQVLRRVRQWKNPTGYFATLLFRNNKTSLNHSRCPIQVIIHTQKAFEHRVKTKSVTRQ